MQNIPKLNDCQILEDLKPVAEQSLNNHISNKDPKVWNPSDLVPFEKSQESNDLDSATLSALYVNGLTEDNLAHYTSTLKRLFGREGVWGEWNNRWTWEESLHGRVIERYVDHIGVFDNNWLEEARKIQITSGNVPEPHTITEISIYASIQEELTRLAHSRLSNRLKGVGRKVFALIAGDELRHHHFYNNISTAIRERFPDEFAMSLHNVVRHFDMPGLGIPGFKEHSEDIERAGIFTTQDVAKTIGNIATNSWGVENLVDDSCTDQAKTLSDKIIKRLGVYKRISEVVVDKSQAQNLKVLWQDGKPIYI